MEYNECKYVILEVVDITQEMVDECVETSIVSLRKTNAGTYAILKWYSRDETPLLIAALDPAPTKYTKEEILTLLNDPENDWIPPPPPDEE